EKQFSYENDWLLLFSSTPQQNIATKTQLTDSKPEPSNPAVITASQAPVKPEPQDKAAELKKIDPQFSLHVLAENNQQTFFKQAKTAAPFSHAHDWLSLYSSPPQQSIKAKTQLTDSKPEPLNPAVISVSQTPVNAQPQTTVPDKAAELKKIPLQFNLNVLDEEKHFAGNNQQTFFEHIKTEAQFNNENYLLALYSPTTAKATQAATDPATNQLNPTKQPDGNLTDIEFADTQSLLGSLYLEGKGVPQDYSRAVYWYQKAADQGSATAITSLKELSLQAPSAQAHQ
ncbi:MAG: hypothetical protein ABL925_05785, partial [Methylococcales bacterium]